MKFALHRIVEYSPVQKRASNIFFPQKSKIAKKILLSSIITVRIFYRYLQFISSETELDIGATILLLEA